MRSLRLMTLLAGGALFCAGCNSILGLGDYSVGPDASGPSPGQGGSCSWEPSSGQCYPCTPARDVEFLNACTTAQCVVFDDKRLTKMPEDGGLPPVPELPGQDAGEPFDPGPSAAAECGSVANGPIVWVTGTAKNYLAALARTLFVDPDPITIIWRGNSSCEALDATLNGTGLGEKGAYWDPSSTAPNNQVDCNMPPLDAGGGIKADISITDVFASTCMPLPNGLPNNVGDFLGPVQTMTFIVPQASTEKSISANGAYFVYGFGGESGVSPWTDPLSIFRLDNASGTQRIIAAGIGVPVDRWRGVNVDHSAILIKEVTSPEPGTAQATIGILAATNITDTLQTQLNVLAYKHRGQQCAYYPDSSPSSRDKRNVRDGHYALWAPLHIFTKIDAKGYPQNPHAGRVINYLTGATPPPGNLDLVQVAAINNLVPTCAMRVKRESEMGPLSPFAATNPCHCHFEKVAAGASSCTPCQVSSDCPASAPVCSFGACESP
jgi:hypothetical protein